MPSIDRDRLRQLITARDTTPRAVSRAVGDNAYLVRDILSGRSANPRYDTILKIAQHFGIPVGEITDASAAESVATNTDPRLVPAFLPVRFRVQAGMWLEDYAFADDFTSPPQPVAPDPRHAEWRQWLEQVIGDSVNLKIPEGGFAHVVDAVQMGYAPRHGDFVVVERRRNGGHLRERTIKQVEIGPAGLLLVPRSTNPKWSEPLSLTGGAAANDEIEVEVVGLVVGFYVGL